MDDGGYVSRIGIAAGMLWATVVGLLMAAWAVATWSQENWLLAGMLAATGCATSAMAATLQIKTYACKMSRLIRATASVRSTGEASLTSLH